MYENDEGFEQDEMMMDDSEMIDESMGDGDEYIEDVAEEADDDNPWSWAEGQDPEKIRNTWEKFTNEWEATRKEREELAPYKELYDEIQSDAGLQAHIRDYFNREKTPLDELEEVKRGLEETRFQIETERELEDVRKYANQEGLPEFDTKELLSHAAKGNFGNLKAAYRDLFFDEIREASRNQAFDDVKKLKGKAVPKVGAGEVAKASKFSEDDLANMSEEEFIKNYGTISKQFAKGL